MTTTMHDESAFVHTATISTEKLKTIIRKAFDADLNLGFKYGHFIKLSEISSWASEMCCESVMVTAEDLKLLYELERIVRRREESLEMASHA